ncbi:hypothetical protein BAE44_0015740 [Dichanthelium oligosanthes]|uniref:Uncharacterized protein n=1 Tax=Dichanthelium oligosanthes TaxID=888268 RepID=A0A1E5VDQ1_9POAL|nr:hypothetical protein BAE44_0015740 [Dichanthelium oligosanthes]
MNALELELLFALRFRLNVTPDTFARYCAALEGQMMLVATDDSATAAVPDPLPSSASARVSEEEDDERRRHDQQAALLMIRETKDAATVVRHQVIGLGGRAAAGSVPVVTRAAVEMIAR